MTLLLLAVAVSGAAQPPADTIADLEAKSERPEASLQENPDLRDTIAPEPPEARVALYNRLKQDIEALKGLTPGTPEQQKLRDTRLKERKARLEELERLLSALPDVAPAPTPAPAAKEAGTTGQEAIPEPSFSSQAKQPESLKLAVDISRHWDAANVTKSCSNRPYSHSAGVWSVVVYAQPVWSPAAAPTAEDYTSDDSGNLYIPVITLNATTPPVFVVGNRTYVGSARRKVRAVEIVFDNLTLAEAGDLIDRVADNARALEEAYAKAVRYRVWQVAYGTREATLLTKPSRLYQVLTCDIDPTSEPDAFVRLLNKLQDPTEMKLCRAAGSVKVKAQLVPNLKDLFKTAALDLGTVALAKGMLKVLVTQAEDISSTDHERNARFKQRSAEAAPGAGGEVPAKSQPQQFLILDEPCFQLSGAPLLSGSEVKPAVSFRFRYDLYTLSDRVTLKIRGEGDGAQGSQYFQRMKVSVEGTTLLVPRSAGWQVDAGVVGNYSFTRKSGASLDEWKAGGKIEVKTPFLRIPWERPGANGQPTFSIEGAAAGGDATTTRVTNFNLTPTFRYTLRPSIKASLDLNAGGSWSNQARFANHQSYAYANLEGRYNVNADWDYLIKYECGRKDPDYRKFCGWQTGFILVTGR